MDASADAPIAPVHVVLVGDSITYGYSATPADNAYPVVLSRFLGPSFVVENDGAGGTAMLKSLPASYWKSVSLPKATAFANAGSKVVIMFGTNDATATAAELAQEEPDCEAMVTHFQALGADVFFGIPPRILPGRTPARATRSIRS